MLSSFKSSISFFTNSSTPGEGINSTGIGFSTGLGFYTGLYTGAFPLPNSSSYFCGSAGFGSGFGFGFFFAIRFTPPLQSYNYNEF